MKYLYSLALVCALAVPGWSQSYPQSQDQSNQQQYPQQNQQVDPQQNQTYPQQNSTYPNSSYPQNQTYPQQTVSQSPITAQNGSIPAGTQLQIRTNEAINANAQTANRSYSAEIAQDVIGDNGRVLIPRGSQAQLTVGKVSAGNMGTGSNEVALALQSVTVNGMTYQITSNPVKQQSSDERGIGANKRTATMTGGGALLGTVIGAVAGGGKGALIGAIVGGGAGAAAQVATRGSEVKVPAETLLTFKLDQPLTLQP